MHGPAEAFRSRTGRQRHQRTPEQFTRSRLAATRDAYRRLLADYRAAAGGDLAL